MSRENDKRPRRPPARKPQTEGIDVRDDIASGSEVDGSGLDLRAGQHRQELGRNPRDAPKSVNDALSRYKKSQAQKFSEHTPEAREARNADALTADAGQPNPITQDSAVSSDWPVSFGEAKRLGGKKAKKPDKTGTADSAAPAGQPMPQDVPFGVYTQESERSARLHRPGEPVSEFDAVSNAGDFQSIDEQPADEQSKTADNALAGKAPAKDSTLSHERTSVLKQERTRLSHKRSSLAPAIPVAPKGRKINYREGITPTPDGESQKPQNADFEKNLPDDAATGTAHEPALDVTPLVDTISAEHEAVADLAADVLPQADGDALVNSEAAANVGNATDSLAIVEEHRAPDKVANRGVRESSGAVSGEGKKKGSRLKFGDEADSSGSPDSAKPIGQTKSGKKLEKAQHKAERSSEKLQTAKNKVPKKRVLRTNKEFDPEKGKMKPRLRFEEEVKTQHEHLRGSAVTRPIKLGANVAIGYAHKKIFQHEDENVAVRAAHKGELMAESGLRYAYRRHKLAPYRKVQKLEAMTRKQSIRASYRKVLHENPKLKSNPIARMMQKRRIKRDYAKAVREAKRTGTTIKKTATVTQKITAKLVMLVKSNPKVLAIIGLLFLVIIILFGLISSCSSVATSVGQSFAALSYVAEEDDIDDAALLYSELETDLQMRIANIQSEFPGYDEYRFNIDAIGHNPHMLMAYLTAVHHDFTFADVEAVLREIFAEQYNLEITPEVEIRTRTETRTGTGVDEDGNSYTYTYTEEVEYEWHILNVTLTSRSIFEIINDRMDNDQRQHYTLLMQSRGLRQIAGSPFDFNWQPFISSHYGWRIHPISGEKDLHLGVDIAVPTGTPILAANSGTVTFAGNMGGYGLVVFINDGNGIETRYAHCDTILVTVGQTVEAGDAIATVGSTGSSTGPHLHFEVLRDGRHLNPIYFAMSGGIGADRLNFGFPGIPLDDEQFASLIAIAEGFMGIPYVWGGSNPAQGFDCSGLVSYLLQAAGVRDVGRLTAQGLYNISTPVSSFDARPGDLIFFEGTFASYRTVTHVGVYVGNGYMLHTGGNPAGVEYTNIRTNFWQRHFYAFGRI